MSYKHWNFKCVLFKHNALSCLDPALTMEILCSEWLAGLKSKQLFQINHSVCFPDLGSVLGLPKNIFWFSGCIFTFLITSSPLFKSMWNSISGQVLFSAKVKTILIGPLMMEKMIDLARTVFAMSCCLQLFSRMIFWIETSLTGTELRKLRDLWPWKTMFLVNPCVSLLCLSCSWLSVGILLVLVIVSLSRGVTAFCKGVLHPGAWEEASLFH